MHDALTRPIFLPDSRALRNVLIVESPPAFQSRLIFTGVEPLDRARVPTDLPRAARLAAAAPVMAVQGGAPVDQNLREEMKTDLLLPRVGGAPI
jgi:hypothetical protein